jgi:trk system potassium uptake protein TrkH
LRLKNITSLLSPQLVLALSFIALISLGAILLSLPVSSTAPTHFVDALFTATSAACVTGLVVVDTGSHWTLFGQIVILLLIQFGGLGIMTFTSFIILIIARRLSFWDRDIMEISLGGDRRQPLGHLLWAIFGLTLVFEIFGAIILTLRFSADYSWLRASYLGTFHAVSAFCNAGFSIFNDNMVGYQSDVITNLTIAMLIFFGGIGFWVLFDLKNIFKYKRNLHSTTLHTRLVVVMSLLLIAVGFVVFTVIEWNRAFHAMPIPTKFVAALFHAVSARTAGFNSVDIATFSNASIFLFLILMVIGASPGSCGGGIKTSTFAVLLAMTYSRIKNQKQVRLSKRGIPDGTVSKAIAITAAALLIISIFCFLLLVTENVGHADIPQRTLFIDVLFETISAFGTVGLSMGLTPVLSLPGKILIILLMTIGRVGPVTLVLALTGIHQKNIKYAEENVWIG